MVRIWCTLESTKIFQWKLPARNYRYENIHDIISLILNYPPPPPSIYPHPRCCTSKHKCTKLSLLQCHNIVIIVIDNFHARNIYRYWFRLINFRWPLSINKKMSKHRLLCQGMVWKQQKSINCIAVMKRAQVIPKWKGIIKVHWLKRRQLFWTRLIDSMNGHSFLRSIQWQQQYNDT